MAPEDQKGVPSPEGEVTSGSTEVSSFDDPYGYYSGSPGGTTTEGQPPAVSSGATSSPPAPPRKPAPPPAEEEDADDDDMLRMSFMEHLDELRMRIIRALMGLGVAFIGCMFFAKTLWAFVSEPALVALKNLKFPAQLVQISPMDTFSIVWVKLPLLASLFIASPWVLYQVWAFIAPGLYKRERRWAAPFIICSAGLFIAGGAFGYFVAFRYGLEFLLGIGHDISITPMVSITEYFDMFVNVMLGIGIVFELPVLIFFLTLLHVVNPAFLLRHSRYAILAIVLVAAVITPTPDIFNLTLFAIPMCLLFFMGIFAGYLLVLKREQRRFPWKPFFITLFLLIAFIGAILATMVFKYGYHIVWHSPFLVK